LAVQSHNNATHSQAPTILWFRQDLRLSDHPALSEACDAGGPVIPIYIDDAATLGDWAHASASRWWLHHSLAALDSRLRECGSRLHYARGDALDQLRRVIEQSGAGAVYWSRCYEPHAIERDKRIKRALADDGVDVRSFKASLLFEPWEIETKSGGPYQVFSPFWKMALTHPVPDLPLAAPSNIPAPTDWPDSLALADLDLLPTVDWAGGLRETWTPGESGAQQQFDRFLSDALEDYKTERDRPDQPGTSMLSPHLHFGEISPRQVWRRVREAGDAAEGHVRFNARKNEPTLRKSALAYLREIGWREFGYHLLYHFPKTTDHPLRERFEDFPWRDSDEQLRAWRKGRTGYPIVDAAMRQLWHTGWMHNRCRMIVASFLVKDLRIHWLEGARWFWDTLVDADLANNTLGWQWVGGCGADAAPYFRIFNPVTQGEKFDPHGDYVRRYVPELASMPDKFLHKPWQAPPGVLDEADVTLGEDYPEPMVDHSEARDAALDAFEAVKG